MNKKITTPLAIFYSYAHEDVLLRDELNKHLSTLKRLGLITEWYDRDIQAGSDWKHDIDMHLENADIILLLISSDFMHSDYCYSVEMNRALQRHKSGEARVIPIILRAIDWEGTPFAHLNMLPSRGIPVTSWPNRDEAFRDIARDIRKVIEREGPRLRKRFPLGTLICSYVPRKGRVCALTWSPDGCRIISGHTNDDITFDVILNTTCFASHKLASFGSRKPAIIGKGTTELHLWNPTTSQLDHTFKVPGNPELQWLQDSKYLVIDGESIWGTKAKDWVTNQTGKRNITGFAWAPDAKHIAFTTQMDGIEICRFETHRPVVTRPQFSGFYADSYSEWILAWSPDGSKIATIEDHSGENWGQEDETVWDPSHCTASVWKAFASQEDTYPTSSDPDTVFRPEKLYTHRGLYISRHWECESSNVLQNNVYRVNRPKERRVYPDVGPYPYIRFSKHKINDTLLNNAYSISYKDFKRGERGGVPYDVAWSSDSARLAWISTSQTETIVEICNAVNNVLITKHLLASPSNAIVVFSPNWSRFASTEGSLVHLWDVVTGKKIFTYQAHISDVHLLAWSPDSTRIASADSSAIHLWQAK